MTNQGGFPLVAVFGLEATVADVECGILVKRLALAGHGGEDKEKRNEDG